MIDIANEARRSLSVVVQAGGQSRRMGSNKALMVFQGQPLIERVVQRVAPISAETLLTANSAELFAFLNKRIEQDILPGLGALGGLYTALQGVQTPYAAVVACDMPFIRTDVLLRQFQLLVESGSDCVIPETEHGLEPMHGVYRVSTCASLVKAALKRGEMQMRSWYKDAHMLIIPLADLRQIDPKLESFINVNTLEEFHQAEQHQK
jgi:molybdopterin-guanine dinucleotide biosynthesis protein A